MYEQGAKCEFLFWCGYEMGVCNATMVVQYHSEWMIEGDESQRSMSNLSTRLIVRDEGQSLMAGLFADDRVDS